MPPHGQTGPAPLSLPVPMPGSPAGLPVPAISPPRGALVPAKTPPPPVNLAATLRSLRRHWFLALALGVLSAAGAIGLVWCFLKPTATVRSLLKLEPIPPKVVFQVADNTTDNQANFV